MFVIGFLTLIFILCSFALMGQSKSSVVMCNSTSCTWNKLCRCTKKEISVYDNTVKGLCLNHTESMKERILDPMREKRIIETNSGFGTEMIDKAMKLQEEKLLEDPKAFAKWMRKHGM